MAHLDEARLMLAAAYKDWRALAGMTDPDIHDLWQKHSNPM